MDGATPSTVAGSPPPAPVPARNDLARELAARSGSGDGGIISQLASNPFFTAVRVESALLSRLD